MHFASRSSARGAHTSTLPATSPRASPTGICHRWALRLRLRANYPVAGFPRQARIVLTALKRYGMIVADNGSSWYVSGAPDPRWSNDQLHTLHRVHGSDFVVVNTSTFRP